MTQTIINTTFFSQKRDSELLLSKIYYVRHLLELRIKIAPNCDNCHYKYINMKTVLNIGLFILLCMSHFSFAQTPTIDSLENVLQTKTLHDTTRMNVLYRVGAYYKERDFEKSNRLLNDALAISKPLKKHLTTANVYNGLGFNADAQSKPIDEVLDYYNKAIEYYKKSGHKKEEANVLNNIGLAYRRVGKHKEASVFNLKALELAKSIKDTTTIINTLNNTAILFAEKRSRSKAKEYYFKSLKYAEMADNKRMISTINNNLSNIYLGENKVDSAIILLRKALKVARKLDNEFREVLPLANLGKAYSHKEVYDSTNKYLNEAYALAVKLDYPYGKGLSLYYLTLTSHKQKKYGKAIDYAEKGLELLGSDGELFLQISYYKTISDSYKELNNYKLAYENLHHYRILKDSVYDMETEQKISAFETKEKEQQLALQNIELSKKTLQRNGFIVLAIVLLLSGWYFWWQSRKLRKSKKIIEKQANELHQVYDNKNRFFANIAHELRTPLTLIAGPISSILQKNQLPTTTYQSLSIVNRNVKYLKQLTNQILDLSKKEAEELNLQITTFKFSDMLKALIEDFQSYANHQKITFVTPSNIENNLVLSTDGEKLFIVLKNLLSNAFKYTNSDGQVTFNYLEINDQIQIAVQDTGRGISKDNLENIFKRYFQTNDINAPIEGGTGIGLAVCKEYIEKLGGTIQVSSEIGKGSTFVVQFPKKIGSENNINTTLSFLQPFAVQKIELNKAASIVSNEMPILLIVEDNLDICQYLQTILQNDYQIAFANNGVEALKQLETHTPDLIITDLMMPLMDGFELVKNLKKQDKFRSIPIITLTARSEMTDKLQALRIGIDDYLIKPFDNEELKVRIENLLDNRANRNTFTEVEALETDENPQSDTEPKMTDNVTISEEDAVWLQQLETVVDENIADINFNANQLILLMSMSRSQLYRTIKRLAGLTPKEYIDQVRYHQARQFLEKKTYNSVKRIAYEVGFKDEKNFARNFKKRYGKYPSTYLE